jgi:hypothetical protein
MINRKSQSAFNIIFLTLFLFLTLFINFLHTEDSLQTNNNCPACHFQNSTQATSQINFFLLPQLALLEILKTFEVFQYDYLICVEPNSRAPPQA